MFIVLILYALQLVDRIHEPESSDRRFVATECPAALLPIRARAIGWPSLSSKAWQPLHYCRPAKRPLNVQTASSNNSSTTLQAYNSGYHGRD